MKFCKSLPAVLAVIIATLVSCGKMDMATPDTIPVNSGTPPQSGNNPAKIEGTWEFKGIYRNAINTSTIGNRIAITYENYTTVNNSGICNIDGSNLIVTALSYSVNSKIKIIAYKDGILTQDGYIEGSGSTLPYTGTTSYKLIGVDSIHTDQSFIEEIDYGNSEHTQGVGAKISWDGDTLLLTKNINLVNAALSIIGSEVIKFVKKK